MNEIQLTDQQQAAIAMVKSSRVSILSGGPGTGKTTATKEIINWAESENLKIVQAAPTGKAAKRLIESTNRYASTIHSMLGCTFDNGQFKFIHGKNNPLPVDLIILDEVSMITCDLMVRVLEAVDIKRTKLLLIGDQDQLPSVGAGAVLRDLLASGAVPHVELDKIHRNTGLIVEACHQIKSGQIYTPRRKLDLSAENPINLIHIECFTPEMALEGLQKIMCEVIPEKYGFDPVNDIQLISPVNSKGVLSCDSINKILRDRLNPLQIDQVFSDEDQNYQFRTGDKVINTKNCKVTAVGGKTTAIVNGDIGIVQSVSDKIITVLFSDPDREVEILKKEQNLLHAYCITCHRFQGSEAPVIIIPVHNQFNYFLSNAWIYTAISRAKSICVTVGTFVTIEKAIRNRVPNNRKTKLKERLIKADRAMMAVEFEGI